jgi:hypothetical protein
MFAPITKEEMQERVERDFAALKSKMEEKKILQVEVEKRPVGRPPKALETILVKMEKSPPKTKKVRGQYTNWFAPSLWGPIHLAVRKYRSIHYALKHLKTMYKTPGESQGVYENLSRGSMYEWFTSRGELKEGYKQYVNEGSSHFQGGTQHCPILSKHPEVEELIIQTLKGHKKVGQPLYARLVRILILSIIKKKAPELLLEEGQTTFRVSHQRIKRFLKSEFNWTI